MKPVLVTDALLRKSLAAVRSIGRKGIPVYAAEATRLTPAGFSRYCTGSLRSPAPASEPEAFAEWLIETAGRFKGLVLLPMDDASVSVTLDHAAALEQRDCRFLIAERESFDLASDKYETTRLAQSLGMDCPGTWLPAGTEELPAIAAEAGFPLVVKPRSSSGSRGIRIVHNLADLQQAFGHAAEGAKLPMIQQYIPPGERFDAALLFDTEGRLTASFVQKELRHYPADIGPSTVQESVWMPELAEAAETLLRKLNWRGIAEVEWMRDPRDGRLKLMEINPRYWNSLHLAIQSGIDFPSMHYRLILGERVHPVSTYAVGQMARNLLPGDLLHAMSTRRLRSLNPPLIGTAGRPVEDDILSWQDPMATVGFAAACARYAFDIQMWKALFSR